MLPAPRRTVRRVTLWPVITAANYTNRFRTAQLRPMRDLPCMVPVMQASFAFGQDGRSAHGSRCGIRPDRRQWAERATGTDAFTAARRSSLSSSYGRRSVARRTSPIDCRRSCASRGQSAPDKIVPARLLGVLHGQHPILVVGRPSGLTLRAVEREAAVCPALRPNPSPTSCPYRTSKRPSPSNAGTGSLIGLSIIIAASIS